MNASTTNLVSCEETQSVSEAQNPVDYGSTDNAPPGYEPSKKRREEDVINAIRRAKQESDSTWEFTKFLVTLCLGSVIWSLVLVLTLAIPIAMLVIGIVYIKDCPKESHIPVFLIVGGTASILSNLLNVVDRHRRFGDTNPPDGVSAIGCVTSVLNCFNLGWFIAGCVWVYRIYAPSYDPSAGDLYCNSTVYLFSFWLLNSCFIFVGAIFVLGVCVFFVTMTVL